MGQTPNYLLPYPELADPADANDGFKDLADRTDVVLKQEHDQIDGRLDVLESQFAAFQTAEPGDYCYSARASKAGWLLCDGTAVSRTVYAALFAIIGTQYGAGDNANTFNVPNLKGKALFAYDAQQAEFNALGKNGGTKAETLTVAQMPTHTHRDVLYTGSGPGQDVRQGTASTGASNPATYGNADAGGGQAHNNLPPYSVANVFIKT